MTATAPDPFASLSDMERYCIGAPVRAAVPGARPDRTRRPLDAEDRRALAVEAMQHDAMGRSARDLLCDLTMNRLFADHDALEAILERLAEAQADGGYRFEVEHAREHLEGGTVGVGFRAAA